MNGTDLEVCPHAFKIVVRCLGRRLRGAFPYAEHRDVAVGVDAQAGGNLHAGAGNFRC